VLGHECPPANRRGNGLSIHLLWFLSNEPWWLEQADRCAYTPDDGSGATTWAVDKRIKEAVAAGRMVHNSRGHYAITREFYDEMVRKNGAQSRQSA